VAENSEKRSSHQKTNQSQQSQQQAFAKIFRRARKKLIFSSARLDEPETKMVETLIQAAFSKCLDFNLICNGTGKSQWPSFTLVSNLRGICEDLVYLTYLSRMKQEDANQLAILLSGQAVTKAIRAQRNFFALNNPFQPVVGGGLELKKVESMVKEAANKMEAFWKAKGINRRGGPTIKDLAEQIGLTSTYDYIYFAASNFVHFNPQTLYRTGWGPSEGPFTFSMKNMDAYYRDLSSFYGSVLFIGFNASFKTKLNADLKNEIEELLELIGFVQRWPEIVTFEEMNRRPPLYLLTHALGKVMRQQDQATPYGAILMEVQSLEMVTK